LKKIKNLLFNTLNSSFLPLQLSLFAIISILLHSCVSSKGRYTGYVRHTKSIQTIHPNPLATNSTPQIEASSKANEVIVKDEKQSITQKKLAIKEELAQELSLQKYSESVAPNKQKIKNQPKTKQTKPKSVLKSVPKTTEIETKNKLTTNDIILITCFFTGILLLLISFVLLFSLSQLIIPFTSALIMALGPSFIISTYIIAIILKKDYKANKRINWHIILILTLGGILSAIIISGALTLGILILFSSLLNTYTSLLWMIFGFFLALLLILFAMLIAFK